MVTLVNRAKMSTSTTGTGTITLGSAETGYQSFADAGVADGDVVRYVIEDGDDWEIGSGTYTATGTTLTRTVDESSNADAALNLTGSAVVFITAAAEDVFQGELFAENYTGAFSKPSATGSNAVAIGPSASATGSYAVAMGLTSTSTASSAIAIGFNSSATGTWATAIGRDTSALWQRTTAIGVNSAAGGSKAKFNSGAMALGGSYASGTDSLAAANASNSSSYGATGANSIAIGQLSKATATNSIAIGDTAVSSTANQISLGGTTDTIQISGAYTLPTSDGTSGQVLTTDGAGAVTFSTPSGGGSPDLYAENYDGTSTLPSATGTNAVAIGSGSSVPAAESVAIGTGASTGAGFRTLALGYNASASQGSAIAIGRGVTAGSGGSTAIGLNSSLGGSVTGGSNSYATALGGSYASGSNSLAAAIANNTSSYGATGSNSVAIGYQAKASNSYAFSVGQNNIASAFGAVAIGRNSTASGNYSVTLGNQAVALQQSKMSFSAGRFTGDGDAQTGTFVLRSDTTDATAEALTTSNGTAGTTNQIILPNNSAYSFSGTIIARESATDGSDYASWEVKGALLRDANAASTVLGNGIVNKLYATSGASTWAVALSADTTNGGLKVEVTGAAATNIRWVATVNTSEVTYA